MFGCVGRLKRKYNQGKMTHTFQLLKDVFEDKMYLKYISRLRTYRMREK